jgi:hypothetical protein
MISHLVVTRPFLGFVQADIISDSGRITEIMAADYKKFVTRVLAPNTSKG